MDTSKIKIGDTVRVEGIVSSIESIENDHGTYIAVNFSPVRRAFFAPSEIKSHKPAPTPINVGDTVIWKAYDRYKERFVVLGIDYESNQAWIKKISRYGCSLKWQSVPLKSLKFFDPDA